MAFAVYQTYVRQRQSYVRPIRSGERTAGLLLGVEERPSGRLQSAERPMMQGAFVASVVLRLEASLVA